MRTENYIAPALHRGENFMVRHFARKVYVCIYAEEHRATRTSAYSYSADDRPLPLRLRVRDLNCIVTPGGERSAR